MEESSAVPDFLLKANAISRSDEDYQRVEYLLRLSLRSTSAKITRLFAINAPHVTVQFEKRTQGLATVDSFIDATKLDESNQVRYVCQRGFKFPPGGMIFPTGTVSLASSSSASSAAGAAGASSLASSRGPSKGSRRRQFEFILCRVGVGRSYYADPAALAKAAAGSGSPITLPEGYHSIYVDPEAEQSNGGAPDDSMHGGFSKLSASQQQRPQGYYHEYLIFDEHQVLPEYYVVFEYDPDADDHKKQPMCDVCEEAPATLYCTQDNARLCRDCDEEIHAANKLLSRHIRVPMMDQPQPYTMCTEHSAMLVEFFCPICHVPVCIHCKMIGSHCSGEAASHKLIPIGEAYKTSVSSAYKDDPVIEGRRTGIINQLRGIDSRLEQVNRNAAEVEDQLYAALRQAIMKLHELKQHKLAILLGDESELRRQLEQLEWMESFLRYEKELLNPVEFLSAWKNHSRLRADMQHRPILRAHTDVLPDLKVDGNIDVAEASLHRSGQAAGGNGNGDENGLSDLSHNASTSIRKAIFGRFAANGAEGQQQQQQQQQQQPLSGGSLSGMGGGYPSDPFSSSSAAQQQAQASLYGGSGGMSSSQLGGGFSSSMSGLSSPAPFGAAALPFGGAASGYGNNGSMQGQDPRLQAYYALQQPQGSSFGGQ